MIVKNEEGFLASCLQSVQGLVDEIIIVDTGSTDKTKEIALRFTSKVYDFMWCDDFAAARNESITYARGDWILVLDADETISKKDHERITELMRAKVAGYILLQRNYIKQEQDLDFIREKDLTVKGASHNKEGLVRSEGDSYAESEGTAGWFPVPMVRLFRHQPGAQFTGVVHEDVSSSLKGNIVSTAIPIHHYGKLDRQQWQKKWSLYEHLAEKKALQEQDYYAYFELGRQYLENKKIELAQEMFHRSLQRNPQFWLSWFNLGTIELFRGNTVLAITYLLEAKRYNSGVGAVYENLGVAYCKQSDFTEALLCFQKGIELNPVSASLYKNLGLCYDQLGQKEKAYVAFKRAVELNPEYKKQIKVS